VVRIDEKDYAFVAQSLATLTGREMGQRVGSLMADHGDQFGYALDILLTGF
jgi:toxin CcdB